jgi:DNA primase
MMNDLDSPRERGYDLVARRLLELCPLRQQRDVVTYLEARNILADAEGVGILALPAPNAQPSIIRKLLHDGIPRDALAAAGIIREGYDAIDWPNHRVMIPWRHPSGRITALQRRTLLPREPKYVFPRGGWRPRMPFGADLFDASVDAPLVLTEGALDTLARRKLARRWGERVQVLGVPAVSILFDPKTWAPFVVGRDVIVAFDSDEAGARAAVKFAREMCTGARSVVRERLEGAKDFGEAVLAAEVLR